jgi:HSP20 family protein
MAEEFPMIFNRLLNYLPEMETPEWPYPWGVTTEEKEKEFVVRAELPGFEPEEVKLELIGERLVIEAEHNEPAEKTEEAPKSAYAHVERIMTLPAAFEPEKVEAVYRNGMLEVHVPRKPEAVGRRIEVKT